LYACYLVSWSCFLTFISKDHSDSV
jgi:hypothetical protein